MSELCHPSTLTKRTQEIFLRLLGHLRRVRRLVGGARLLHRSPVVSEFCHPSTLMKRRLKRFFHLLQHRSPVVSELLYCFTPP